MDNTTSFKLLPGEVEIKRIENTAVTQTAFLMCKMHFGQQVIVTNKRVAIINGYMPESFNSPFSICYKVEDCAKLGVALLLDDVIQEKEFTILKCKSFWIFPGQKWKIKDLEISDIVLKNKNL